MKTASKNLRNQAGMTYLGMLILLIVIAFFAVVMIKVVPLYLEHFKVKSVLDSLKEESDTAKLPPNEIERRIMSRLDVNDVENVEAQHIKVERSGGQTVVTIDYEARVPLFANLDVVAGFDNRVELGAP